MEQVCRAQCTAAKDATTGILHVPASSCLRSNVFRAIVLNESRPSPMRIYNSLKHHCSTLEDSFRATGNSVQDKSVVFVSPGKVPFHPPVKGDYTRSGHWSTTGCAGFRMIVVKLSGHTTGSCTRCGSVFSWVCSPSAGDHERLLSKLEHRVTRSSSRVCSCP